MMKVKDLIKQLDGKEDWEIEFAYSRLDDSEWGLTVDYFKQGNGVDYGYSDKIIIIPLIKQD